MRGAAATTPQIPRLPLWFLVAVAAVLIMNRLAYMFFCQPDAGRGVLLALGAKSGVVLL